MNSFITKTLYKTKLPKTAPDMNDFKTDRLYYKSKDGTRVPMFIIRKKSILPSIHSIAHKPIPTIIYAYGGFGEP